MDNISKLPIIEGSLKGKLSYAPPLCKITYPVSDVDHKGAIAIITENMENDEKVLLDAVVPFLEVLDGDNIYESHLVLLV